LATLPQHELLACRDTQHDVGTAVTTASEAHRPNPKSVVTAGFKRVQEALRSLEEFGKLLDPQLAQRFEQMRYRTYTLERAVGTTRDARTQLASSRLYVLLDALGSLDEFKRVADELVAAGVDVIQLRAKNVSDRVLVERGKALRAATAGSRTLYVMNDRADLAVLTQADGVHVGQDELSVFEVRHIAGPAMLIGVSTHTIEQARQAVLDGANYLGVGPVFPSGTKSFERLAGLDLVRAVAAEIALPAFAIGGISSENVDSVLAAGLGRVAVSGAILFAADRTAACRGLLRLLAVRDTES
jgi:thiamine-phosphate pyrophosphorylase